MNMGKVDQHYCDEVHFEIQVNQKNSLARKIQVSSRFWHILKIIMNQIELNNNWLLLQLTTSCPNSLLLRVLIQ